MKPAVILAALLVAAAPALAQAPAQAPAAAPPAAAGEDPVVARVNGTEIRRSEVMTVRAGLPAQYQQVPLEVLFPLVVDRLIDMRLLADEGRRARLNEDPEVRRRVASYEDRVVQEVFLDRMITQVVTDAAIRERFERLRRETPAREQIRARHILVAEEAQARAIIAELAAGADFAQIAATRSLDPGGRAQGGDLGFFTESEMVAEFWAGARALQAGQTSTAPVRSEFGWHVIRVEERRSSAPSLEESRERIVGDLQQEAIDTLLTQLRQGARIERVGQTAPPLQMAPQPAAPVAPATPPQPRR